MSAYKKKYFERTKFMINIRPMYIIPFSSEVKRTMHDLQVRYSAKSNKFFFYGR